MLSPYVRFVCVAVLFAAGCDFDTGYRNPPPHDPPRGTPLPLPAKEPRVDPASVKGPIVSQGSDPDAGDDCELMPNGGCPPDEVCTQRRTSLTTVAAMCIRRQRSLAEGSDCNSDWDCEPGTACIGHPQGVCRRYCDADDSCGDAFACLDVKVETSAAISGYRVCFESCSEDEGCDSKCCREVDGARVCVADDQCGTKGEGDSCAADNDCRPSDDRSLVCEDTCRQLCEQDKQCESGCCQGGRCAAAAMCESVKTGGSCQEDRDCIGNADGEAACITGPTSTDRRCVATCNDDRSCGKGACCAVAQKGEPRLCVPGDSDSCPSAVTAQPPEKKAKLGKPCRAQSDCALMEHFNVSCISVERASEKLCEVECRSDEDCGSARCNLYNKAGDGFCVAN